MKFNYVNLLAPVEVCLGLQKFYAFVCMVQIYPAFCQSFSLPSKTEFVRHHELNSFAVFLGSIFFFSVKNDATLKGCTVLGGLDELKLL